MPEARTSDAEEHGRDLAILAHEVRGSLTAISGYAELLARPLSESDRERALLGIQRAVRRIDAMLASSTAGESVRPPARRVSLNEVAARVVADARAVSGRDIQLERIDDDGVVLGTEEALERALANLVDNALKFSPASSEVLVRIARDDGRVLMQVLDRGPGIAEGDSEKIFEPFERAGGMTVPGTGLGLTVVKSVAEAHRGEAWVAARPGGGAEFTIALPEAG